MKLLHTSSRSGDPFLIRAMEVLHKLVGGRGRAQRSLGIFVFQARPRTVGSENRAKLMRSSCV